MASEAAAFAPSHITGFFQIFSNGSTGAGVNTALGATTSVRLTGSPGLTVSVRINGEPTTAPVSNRVIAKFLSQGSLDVTHEIGYPIGYGMGMSGAGAFSLALAMNEVLGRPHSPEHCMELAVQAEIESGTGLGDVVAQQFRGVMFGLEPYPSRSVELIPAESFWVVCAFFAPLETKKIIRDASWKERINKTGAACMAELKKEKTLTNFIELSRKFTFETGLANGDVRAVLEAVPESSMAMLGQTAFALTREPDVLREKFGRFTDRIIVAPVADHGAKVL